jgi:hypothetical protein
VELQLWEHEHYSVKRRFLLILAGDAARRDLIASAFRPVYARGIVWRRVCVLIKRLARLFANAKEILAITQDEEESATSCFLKSTTGIYF